MEILFFLFVATFALVGAFKLDRFMTKKDEQNADTLRRREDIIAKGAIAEAELKRLKDNDWYDVGIPENRPSGKWVNWKFQSGWIKVRGTSHHRDSVSDFLKRLYSFDADEHRFRILLTRDPSNEYDANAVTVHAVFDRPARAAFMLGHIEADAAEWLADNFSDDMPIAATLMRCSTNGIDTSFKICGLMPPKAERRQFEIA